VDFATLFSGLSARSYAIFPHFLSPELSAGLHADFEQCLAAGEFQRATVGKDRQLADHIRRDEIRWLEPAALNAAQSAIWAQWESLREGLNRELLLGLWSLEAHYARYQPGAFYARHVDRFLADDTRVVSLVLYLNPDWESDQGGELVLYDAAGSPQATVLPELGTLAVFLSDQIPHEVLPAARERRSLAGWFRRRP
jgi:SM-20-related protein